MTARWVVEEVSLERQLNVTWQPISLLMKNMPAQDERSYPRYRFTHNLLRVMESVRESEGDDGVLRFYWEVAARLHYDRDYGFDPVAALRGAGLDGGHGVAFSDESWDAEIARRMAVGIELAGTDIGTPIVAFDNLEGERVGIFGPVITRVPPREQALQLWDGMVAVATVPGFWELKRTRTEPPDLGIRPEGAL